MTDYHFVEIGSVLMQDLTAGDSVSPPNALFDDWSGNYGSVATILTAEPCADSRIALTFTIDGEPEVHQAEVDASAPIR